VILYDFLFKNSISRNNDVYKHKMAFAHSINIVNGIFYIGSHHTNDMIRKWYHGQMSALWDNRSDCELLHGNNRQVNKAHLTHTVSYLRAVWLGRKSVTLWCQIIYTVRSGWRGWCDIDACMCSERWSDSVLTNW